MNKKIKNILLGWVLIQSVYMFYVLFLSAKYNPDISLGTLGFYAFNLSPFLLFFFIVYFSQKDYLLLVPFFTSSSYMLVSFICWHLDISGIQSEAGSTGGLFFLGTPIYALMTAIPLLFVYAVLDKKFKTFTLDPESARPLLLLAHWFISVLTGTLSVYLIYYVIDV